ncbi:MAG TPA: phosphoribosylaminoimidazolecarboxamide formyltransferase [Clostridiales bacterium]|nr:phosphoribosylaminoimidazolecarboxamide formyltransferase [Clostridiales bacterium]
MKTYELKYGCNPHQKPARIHREDRDLPFKILNGNPGYINLMDAFNSWQLVRELKGTLGLPAAASFKHVSPAGAALGLPLNDTLKKAYHVEGIALTPVACAYARARGADRMSSFGDWAALSDTVDTATALILKKEVSDGIIAPAYTPEALEILKTKKGGKYNILEIDPAYEPEELEPRKIFGITFEQKHNDIHPGFTHLENIVTQNHALPDDARRDLVLAMITLKYTQSNSVCYVKDGQVIGNGAGQQSRIHCTRLAGDKADVWYLKQHPCVLSLAFREGTGKPEMDNIIDQFVRNDITDTERAAWKQYFDTMPRLLTPEEKREWLNGLKGVSVGSDAFFPFRDNIDRAVMSGAQYLVQPGGSVRDADVIRACDEYGIVMCFNGIRLFHH